MAVKNILATESWNHVGNNAYSVNLFIPNTQITANGKGISTDLALASAYGELVERLSLLLILHAQQLFQSVDGKKEIYYAPFTKNEKGVSADGRQFPLTNAIKELLGEIKAKQEALGIKSEFIFCNEDGKWMVEEAYTSFLRRLCRSKGLDVTNNHAFRMSLNSNVFIPMGISVADRAALLGHSIETNMKYYSYSQKNLIDDVKAKLDCRTDFSLGTQREPNKIVPFAKKETPETLISQYF